MGEDQTIGTGGKGGEEMGGTERVGNREGGEAGCGLGD